MLVNAQRSAVEEDHGRRGVDRSRENGDDRLALADVHEVRASPGAGMVQQLLEGGDRSGWVVVGAARPEKYVISEGSIIDIGAAGGVMTEVGTDKHVREEDDEQRAGQHRALRNAVVKAPPRRETVLDAHTLNSVRQEVAEPAEEEAAHAIAVELSQESRSPHCVVRFLNVNERGEEGFVALKGIMHGKAEST